jgi:hypothetical protein
MAEAARDCNDASDLSQRLQSIQIDRANLNFGSSTIVFTQGPDILDLCIHASLFLEIDVWACLLCNEDLGILDEEGVSKGLIT